jgi:hypothetical protein
LVEKNGTCGGFKLDRAAGANRGLGDNTCETVVGAKASTEGGRARNLMGAAFLEGAWSAMVERADLEDVTR